jgi:murein DD-endopeptidase MepM/ murein hydrolase activator NlpD
MSKTRRILSVLFALLLFCSSISCVFATQQDIDDKKGELKDVQQDITDTKKALESKKSSQTQLTSEIKTLEKQIYVAEAAVNSLQIEINDTIEKINTVLAELEEMENQIGEQNSNLNARLRAMYKNGNIGMLSVLLGSGNMSQLLTNYEMVSRIYDSDAKLLASMEKQYDAIYKKKQELVSLKDTYTKQQDAMSARKTELANNKVTLKEKKSQVDADIKELEKQVDALNKEANALTAEIIRLQGTQNYVGGTMLWPSQASKYVSSPFGNRLHPILKVYKMHTGIDIAAAHGTNILAANAGKVISAGYNSGYGYCVMIDHGGGIVTLYAHASKLLVKTGAVVTRGQVIALVGSTGMSTGAHLHFEVRVNGVYKNPLEYVSR